MSANIANIRLNRLDFQNMELLGVVTLHKHYQAKDGSCTYELTVPAIARKKLNLKPGSRYAVYLDSGKLIYHPLDSG